jgi:hypothetical protein
MRLRNRVVTRNRHSIDTCIAVVVSDSILQSNIVQHCKSTVVLQFSTCLYSVMNYLFHDPVSHELFAIFMVCVCIYIDKYRTVPVLSMIRV